ncbi:MAG TPA: MarR family transcriptional regulator [Roseiflexaceae bacterium]|jgi:DNA-binding MarR family transcriptional regulator|nr:MarR family transcriptional regulator [Roseiflexaceae bacterium]
MITDRALETAQELLAVLPLLNRIVASEVRREAGEETTISQFRVLAHLAAAPTTLSALAKKRRVSLQSMSELVQALVARGWITREADPSDRRQHVLQLTDHGKRHYERAQEQTLRRLVPSLEQLSDEELAAIQLALPALRRVIIEEECNDASDERSITAAV